MSKRIDTKVSINYMLVGIKELRFSYVPIPKTSVSVKTTFGMGVNFNWRNDEEIIDVIVMAHFTSGEQTEKKEILSIETMVSYKLLDFKNSVSFSEKGQIVLPDEFAITLFSIAISSTRGYLACRTAGTEYSRLLIPIINPTAFLKNAQKTSSQSNKF